jgi:DNA-binding HxlR family transcriptional regulator
MWRACHARSGVASQQVTPRNWGFAAIHHEARQGVKRVWQSVTESVLPLSVGSRSHRACRRDTDVLHGKWKVHLLVYMARGVHPAPRPLARLSARVSKKVMTDTLRTLARRCRARRIAEVPVRVEYSPNAPGVDADGAVDCSLSDWAEPFQGRSLRLVPRLRRVRRTK